MAGPTSLGSGRSRNNHRRGGAWEGSDSPSAPPLSKREEEVLRLLAEGMNNVEIARELYISRQTVKKHVSSIFAKVEADNRVQAAVYAVRQGIV